MLSPKNQNSTFLYKLKLWPKQSYNIHWKKVNPCLGFTKQTTHLQTQNNTIFKASKFRCKTYEGVKVYVGHSYAVTVLIWTNIHNLWPSVNTLIRYWWLWDAFRFWTVCYICDERQITQGKKQNYLIKRFQYLQSTSWLKHMIFLQSTLCINYGGWYTTCMVILYDKPLLFIMYASQCHTSLSEYMVKANYWAFLEFIGKLM